MKRVICLAGLAAAMIAVSHLAAQEPAVCTKMCVRESQPTKKTVYSSVEKEYCQARRPLLDFLHGCLFGHDDDCPACSDVRTTTVLVKKIVPGKPVERCVVKDVPLVMEAIVPVKK